MRTRKGFTLIELMVTLSVVTILAVLAVPSMTPIIHRMQVDTTARDLAEKLKQVRGTAVALRKEVSIRFEAPPTTSTDPEGDIFYWQPDNSNIVIMSEAAPEGVSFTPVGIAKPRTTSIRKEMITNPKYDANLPEDPYTNPKQIPKWEQTADLVFEICHKELKEIRSIRIFKGGVIQAIESKPLLGVCDA